MKGALEPGRHADIAVAASSRRRYDPTASGHSVAGWSPYEGLELHHRIEATFLRGELAFDGKAVVAEPGTGRFVTPRATERAET